MEFRTADLCDLNEGNPHLQIGEPIFQSFGGNPRFAGPIATVKVFEDNVLIREVLEQPGAGRVLVVDGGGSHRCALLGGNLSKLASEQGWAGLIVYGCIRDAVEIATLPIGIRALHTHPLKSHKRGTGERDVLITFAGINFRSGHHVYADEDGVLVSELPLI
jgi:regulator of ribonuclease activity A